MRLIIILAATALLGAALPNTGSAKTTLFTGTMDIVNVSGKACAGLKGKHQVSLILSDGESDGGLAGVFEGKEITTGRFSGSDPARLAVRYPYYDETRASGHFLGLTLSGNDLTAELRDRHLESTDDDCNFDLARLNLKRSDEGDAAEARLKTVSALFDAQSLRSEAFSLARTGKYDAALPLYKKALALADPVAKGNPEQIAPYITGLANAYVKLGMSADFNRLYDERINSITDDGVRTIFSGHRIRTLLSSGKAALAAEDYSGALENFKTAYRIQPQNREALAAVMMAQLKMGEYDGAIKFLEDFLKSSSSTAGQQDVRGALAHVYFLRAKKNDKAGKIDEAEADLKKADGLDPYSVQYLVALARLRHKNGSLSEAEKLLQKGLERFQYEASRQEILSARERMRLTEIILKKIRKAGS